MDNATYQREVEGIIERDGGGGNYAFTIAQYNKDGHCIFNAYILGITGKTLFALMQNALSCHPLAQFTVFHRGETILEKEEYKNVDY